MNTFPNTPGADADRGTALVGERRVGDAERQRAVELLGAAFSQGYLNLAEYEARLQRAVDASTARTVGELLDDLPVAQIKRHDPQRLAARSALARRGVKIHAGMYVAMAVTCLVIWAAVAAGSGEWYFWPIWPILGAGIGLASHAIPALRCSRAPMAAAETAPFRHPMCAFRPW